MTSPTAQPAQLNPSLAPDVAVPTDEEIAVAITESEIPERYRWLSTDEDVPDATRGV